MKENAEKGVDGRRWTFIGNMDGHLCIRLLKMAILTKKKNRVIENNFQQVLNLNT